MSLASLYFSVKLKNMKIKAPYFQFGGLKA